MEGNYLTAGELALIDQRRGYGYGHDGYCDYGHRKMSNGAATGIALGAGLGGAALIGVFLAAWGLNNASKARAKGAENAINLVNSNLAQLTNLQMAETQNRQAALAAERVSRESWQNYHAPTTTQYVDVRSGAFAGAGSTSSALAQAEANLLSNALLGRTQMCPQEVTLVSQRNCGCPCGCND